MTPSMGVLFTSTVSVPSASSTPTRCALPVQYSSSMALPDACSNRTPSQSDRTTMRLCGAVASLSSSRTVCSQS